jgi:ribosomal protein S12 methylthiotransferase accessory factor YcaO
MHQLASLLVAEDHVPAVVTNGRVTGFAASAPDPQEFEVMEAVALRLQPGHAVQRAMQEAQDSGRTKVTGSSDAGAFPSAHQLLPSRAVCA